MNMGPQGSARTGSVIILLTLLAAALVYPSAACIAEERNALLEFKAGITDDPTGLLSLWTADGDCCTWGGTDCDSTGHISRLLLSPDPAFDDESHYLKGTISPALANLTHLYVLDLYNLKQLSGPVPEALGNLKRLVYFKVGKNLLTGSIPSSYGGLTKLFYLHLSHNRLSGSIPPSLGAIGPKLEVLDLGDNGLSGSIPISLYKLTGLQELNLRSNNLTGGISSLIGQLQNLVTIDFFNNQLTGAVPSEIGSLLNLDFLALNRNAFTDVLPASLGNLVNLYSLWLNDNKLTGEIPTSFANLGLVNLDLSNNQLTGPIPISFPLQPAFSGNAGLCGYPLCPCPG